MKISVSLNKPLAGDECLLKYEFTSIFRYSGGTFQYILSKQQNYLSLTLLYLSSEVEFGFDH